MKKKSWFASWFDTKYYHILYKNRNDAEAQLFLDNLIAKLNPTKRSKLLDPACGKGRHSIYMASKGYQVEGVDLSAQSIKHAQQFAHARLSFDTHDMRKVYKARHFNFILNLFTSFGYFDNEQDSLDTLNSVVKGLKKDGIFVMDFFNATKVMANLKAREQKTVDGVRFKIKRSVKNGFIVKNIRFTDKGKSYEFEERVRAYQYRDLKKLFEQAGLEITDRYGNYKLQKYVAKSSDRLILVARKQ